MQKIILNTMQKICNIILLFWIELLTKYEIRQVLICNKHGHWRHNYVKSFRFLRFLENGKKILGGIFCIVLRKKFLNFNDKIFINLSLPFQFYLLFFFFFS